MRILKLISIADIFTVINGLLGLASIMATMSGWYFFALNLILLGVITDGLDGVFARRFSKRWYLGDYLDLMSDTVTFCVAPSILLFRLGFDPSQLAGWYDNILDPDRAPLLVLFGCGAIIVTGILRLARFCYQAPFMGENFIGVPTPSAALTLALLMMLDLRLEEAGWAIISPTILALAAVILSILMICDVPYLKLRGRLEWLAGGLILMAIILNERLEVVAMVFGASVIYLVGAPFALRRKRTGKGRTKARGRRRRSKAKGKKKA